jgi:hypothetical protein
MRSLLLDSRPSNQYILVRVIPSCFRFAKMCLCQVRLLSRCSPRCLAPCRSCTLFIWTGGHVYVRVVNVTWIDLDSLAFILNFINRFWIASRPVCSFCEAMAESLSVATIAVSSAKIAMVGSGEVGRSVVFSRHNNGPWTLPCGTPALTKDSSVYTVSIFTRKCLLCK